MFRDGKPFRDAKTTTLTIALPPLRTYSMAVAAVDTQGQASGMSNAVVIRADHAAPTTPAGLTAAATSASDVALTWQPATGFGGARVAYRVLRNGITFGQTSATSMTIGNLAPSTAYTFTVMAVDSLGYASAPSGPATATTQAPIQSTGVAHVFLLASTGASFRAFQAHYQEIGTVYPTYYECNADGVVLRRRRAADHELGARARREGRGALELPAHDDAALHARRPGDPRGARDRRW